MSKKPIEIIKNYDFKPSQIYEKDGGLFATIQENIISQIVEARDEEYYNFLIKQIRDFIVKNNIETCFVINKEELIDCLQEHNELHCKINNLQSQLDQQKAMWNELKEWGMSFLKDCDIIFDKSKKDSYLYNSALHHKKILIIMLAKMQELEKGEKDVKD